MYFLGEYYAEQYGHVPYDMEASKSWRKKGSELGDVLASLKVAYTLPDDSEEQNNIFESMFTPTLQLAESGDVFAQNELADLYNGGYGVEQNEEEGFKWLKKSAEEGFWKSIDQMGDLYYYGTYVDEDCKEEIKWYRLGCEKGYAKSFLNLAYCYYLGEGTDESKDKALELFKKAYDLGNAEAAYKIGTMSDEDCGIDDEQAFLWMKKSADLGCIDGICGLGDCYYDGSGTSQNYELARECYKKASNGGNNYATTQLGIMAMEDNDYNEAVKCFKIAAENGYDDAQNRLGCRYDRGQGVAEDKNEAFKWFMKSAEHGNMKAQANIGRYYHDGIVVKQDDDLAKEWLRKSSEQGWELAGTWLNEFYGEETESSSSSSRVIKSETYEAIKTACDLFIMEHDEARYDPTYNLKVALDILYEDVYLAHDDTSFFLEKEGFAITENGIYSRDIFESYANYVTFEELANADSIYVKDNYYICADGKRLALLAGLKEELDDLRGLFSLIAMYVKYDLGM